jgi:hypothetical protein
MFWFCYCFWYPFWLSEWWESNYYHLQICIQVAGINTTAVWCPKGIFHDIVVSISVSCSPWARCLTPWFWWTSVLLAVLPHLSLHNLDTRVGGWGD